jgi:hypothetical protein
MAWITMQVAQAGDTTRAYRMTAFGGMTVFDSVAAGPEVGESALSVTEHQSSLGPSHRVVVRSIGAAAVAFRIRGGLQV